MFKADLHQRLNRASEIRLSVKGRKSGRDIPDSLVCALRQHSVFASSSGLGH